MYLKKMLRVLCCSSCHDPGNIQEERFVWPFYWTNYAVERDARQASGYVLNFVSYMHYSYSNLYKMKPPSKKLEKVSCHWNQYVMGLSQP